MSLLERAGIEIMRRTALLPKEVLAWIDKASENVDELGIRRSQFEALQILMTEQFKKLDARPNFDRPCPAANSFKCRWTSFSR